VRHPDFEKQQQIQLEQAAKIRNFKGTEEYILLINTFLALKSVAADQRKVMMRSQTTREMCLYYTGYEDGMQMCMDGIDKIVANGEAILSVKEQMSPYQDQEK